MPKLVAAGMDWESKPFWKDAPPPLPDHLEEVYQAFSRLSSSRAISMGGVGPIPYEAVERYAERHGIEDVDGFWYLIQSLDEVFRRELKGGR